LLEGCIGVGLGIVALCGYLWLLCPGFFPWESSTLAASVMRSLPGNVVDSHPLWHLAARFFALLPVGDLAVRLNVFSALCGAGVVSLLFFLSSQLLFNSLNCAFLASADAYSCQLADAWSPTPADYCSVDVKTAKNRFHYYAMAGGVITAVSFAFCLPFWSAATRLHVQTFELLLLLTTCHVLARQAFSRTPASLFCAAFLIGVGLVESVVFVAFLPIFLVVIFHVNYNDDQISDYFIFLLLAGIGTGLLLAFGAWVAWSGIGRGITGGLLLHIVGRWIAGHTEAFHSGLPRLGWLLIFIYGVLPLSIFFSGARFFDCKTSTMKFSAWVVQNVLFTALVVVAMLNLPGSPWQLTHLGSHLPILPMLGMSIACGHIFVFWALLGSRHDPREADEEDVPGRGTRAMALIVAGAMILLVGATPFRNASEADGRQGVFADRFCREVFDAAPDARCFVTDGAFDSVLLARACAKRRNVTLINARMGLSATPQAMPAEAVPQTNALNFVVDWVRRNGDESSQIALLTMPGVWAQGGLAALPDRVVYTGINRQEPVELAALMERQRACWSRMASLCAPDSVRTSRLGSLHQAMRMHLGRMANDLGVFLLHQDAVQEASEAFQRAISFDKGNVCAALNVYALHQKHPELAPPGDLPQRMESMLRRRPAYASIAEHEERYGTLYRPYAEHLANAYIFTLKPNVSGKELNPFMAQVIDFCRSAMRLESDPLPTPLLSEQGERDEELSLAVQMIMQKQWPMAERQLRTLTAKRSNLLSARALLAEVLMQAGKFNEVRESIIPAMRQVADAKDAELIDMTEGCLALRSPEPDADAARACFIRVLERKPDLADAQKLLLQASLLQGNREILERDCTNLLAHTRSLPLANAILGGIRLQQNRLQEAKALLEASLSARPNAPALNDLAETLRRMNDLPAAEIAARRALLLSMQFHQAWDTLAIVLRDAKRLDEADACTAKARAIRLQVRGIGVQDARNQESKRPMNPEVCDVRMQTIRASSGARLR
jgi:tetratricopeptide (TPR) repeat protein